MEGRKKKSKNSSRQICSKLNCDANNNYSEYNQSVDNTVNRKSKKLVRN